jgi:undecaprenyl diphosphate synthase
MSVKDPEINELNSVAPRHVAIIMDGNGRWAKTRGMRRYYGHRAGVAAVRRTVELAIVHRVEVLTLYAFSRENWLRPEEEISQLMRLFNFALKRETRKLHKNGVRLRIIGERSRFSKKLRDAIERAEALTRHNQRLELVIAVNYSGRWDIVNACNTLLTQAALTPQTSQNLITEEALTRHLSLSDLPDPDLFIRTGGEQRISNYYLWQLAYTELYFCDVLWPDFGRDHFDSAVEWFQGRERRFGKTGDQIQQGEKVE